MTIILGIDPGTTIMGFGILKATSKEMSLIQMNELQLKKYENHFLKLQKIFERTQEIIDEIQAKAIVFVGKKIIKLGFDVEQDFESYLS